MSLNLELSFLVYTYMQKYSLVIQFQKSAFDRRKINFGDVTSVYETYAIR